MPRPLPLPTRTAAHVLAACLAAACAPAAEPAGGPGAFTCRQDSPEGLFMARDRSRDEALADALGATGGDADGRAVHHFLQRFPTTALGRGGVAGRTVSGAWTTVIDTGDEAHVLRDGEPEYAVRLDDPRARERMADDLRTGCVAGLAGAGARYGAPAVRPAGPGDRSSLRAAGAGV